MQAQVAHYLALWQVENPQLIAETFMAKVYRVEAQGEAMALKIFSEDGAYDEIGGALTLDYYQGHGAVKLFRYDEVAQLMEFADGDDLVPMVEAGQDDAATVISAELISKLHQARGKAPELRSLKRWFAALFNKAQADEAAGVDSIFRRGAKLAEALLANPQDELVLHGDIHHGNIRLHSKRGYLVYDPKGIYGERTYDATNMLYNPNDDISTDENRLFRTAQLLAKSLNLDYQRYLQFAFAYGCLSAAWSLEGEDNPVSTLLIAEMLEHAFKKA